MQLYTVYKGSYWAEHARIRVDFQFRGLSESCKFTFSSVPFSIVCSINDVMLNVVTFAHFGKIFFGLLI